MHGTCILEVSRSRKLTAAYCANLSSSKAGLLEVARTTYGSKEHVVTRKSPRALLTIGSGLWVPSDLPIKLGAASLEMLTALRCHCAKM